MPTTEIARIPLKPGSNIGDSNDPAAAVLQDCLRMIAQQDGFQQMQFGTEVENPAMLQLMITWDSIESHKAFMQSSAYGPFFKRFGEIMDGAPTLYHADFNQPGGANKAMGAPVTEVATFFFEGGPPDNSVDSATQFIENCQKDVGTELAGWAYGLTHEEIEKDGVKGKGAVLLIGWQSIEEHMKMREHKTFGENIHLLRQTAKEREVHHTQFMNYVA